MKDTTTQTTGGTRQLICVDFEEQVCQGGVATEPQLLAPRQTRRLRHHVALKRCESVWEEARPLCGMLDKVLRCRD